MARLSATPSWGAHVLARSGALAAANDASADQANIQHLVLRRSPTQRPFGLASLTLAIPKAAASVIDVDADVAEDRFAELAARLLGLVPSIRRIAGTREQAPPREQDRDLLGGHRPSEVEPLAQGASGLSQERELPSVSIPSASGTMPSPCASWTIASTMRPESSSRSTSWMNDRSIFKMSTGRCFSRASDE